MLTHVKHSAVIKTFCYICFELRLAFLWPDKQSHQPSECICTKIGILLLCSRMIFSSRVSRARILSFLVLLGDRQEYEEEVVEEEGGPYG